MNERSSKPSRCAGVVATACTHGKRAQHGKPNYVVERTINRKPVRDSSGVAGWRRGSYYRRSRVTPMEERSLGSRRMQEATRESRLGQPYETRESPGVAKCIPCGSEGRTRTWFEEPAGRRRAAQVVAGYCHDRWSWETRTRQIYHRPWHTRLSVGESMMSCPRAGCGKSACPVR